jgi:S-adenosylmethionine uptake transporter
LCAIQPFGIPDHVVNNKKMSNKPNTYFIGVIYFILSLIISAANDIITRYLNFNFESFQIVFFRFLFSVITLIPLIMYYGVNTLKINNIFIQIVRGVLLFFGMAFWNYGLSAGPVATATIISFTTPLFVLLLAVFFLQEKIIWQRWVATIVGFIGIAITLQPNKNDFNPRALMLIASTLFFATLDIINKKLTVRESTISMLFYSALITTTFSCPMLLIYWQTPSILELILLITLGINANLILFFILRAFTMTDATALAPYRYFELFVSIVASYLILDETPSINTLYGALVLTPVTLFISYSEHKKN